MRRKRGEPDPQGFFNWRKPPDPTPALAARDEAIERVEANADEAWTVAAWAALRRVVASGQPFTTDEVWAAMGDAAGLTHEPRAMGAIMGAASRDGTCHKTGAWLKSASVVCHARDKAVWAPGRA